MSRPRSRTRREFPRSAEVDLRRQAAGGWPHSVRLQHSERIDLALGPPPSWWRQEAQEEELQVPWNWNAKLVVIFT